MKNEGDVPFFKLEKIQFLNEIKDLDRRAHKFKKCFYKRGCVYGRVDYPPSTAVAERDIAF